MTAAKAAETCDGVMAGTDLDTLTGARVEAAAALAAALGERDALLSPRAAADAAEAAERTLLDVVREGRALCGNLLERDASLTALGRTIAEDQARSICLSERAPAS